MAYKFLKNLCTKDNHTSRSYETARPIEKQKVFQSNVI